MLFRSNYLAFRNTPWARTVTLRPPADEQRTPRLARLLQHEWAQYVTDASVTLQSGVVLPQSALLAYHGLIEMVSNVIHPYFIERAREEEDYLNPIDYAERNSATLTVQSQKAQRLAVLPLLSSLTQFTLAEFIEKDMLRAQTYKVGLASKEPNPRLIYSEPVLQCQRYFTLLHILASGKEVNISESR